MPSGPILIVSGTNRPQSHALKIATFLTAEYRAAGYSADLFSLGDLPQEMFLPAAYATKPPSVVEIQDRIFAAGGLHVVTPEYNGSFPGVLKYFIDMLKFPESFEHKCVAFVGESYGMWGGLRPVEHLMQIFGYRNAHIFPDRVFISDVVSKFDGEGKLRDEGIALRLRKQAGGFGRFVERMAAK
jgi:NAD(P)H-dependent FMN reductase